MSRIAVHMEIEGTAQCPAQVDCYESFTNWQDINAI